MSISPRIATTEPPLPPSESRRWIFARVVLDEGTQELLVDGEEVEVERKPFELLRFLLAHAGEVVTKDEILAGVWPGRFLSETVLTKNISRLRDVLGDADQSLIKTVHGYGYRLTAAVRVEWQRPPEPAHFEFQPGDRPPGRPLWSLIRRLGSGGQGEAWLGQHDKTREQRVFKFALDESSLAALKREITLFRFLNDSLGERARIVALIDWNLDQPPCFTESEHIVGGSLIDWAERSGGLARIPLATRLEVAAQVAETLAAVHSVGVLHKDLKPSNVLIDPGSGEMPSVRLADFGSGTVLDPKRLEALGITRLGFTRTVVALGGDGAGATPLYLAPEVLAGQPPTVQADIYALGVMLYQLVTGEFRKAMSPGWEREIEDELLRQDIAQAAEGEFARRLSDAGELAQRLRTIGERREKLAAARETEAQLARARLAGERQRARRVWVIAAAAVLVVGSVTSTVLYVKARQARDEARAALATSRAVSDFLSRDMFAAVGTRPLRDLTVPELLKAASSSLAARTDLLPDAAAQLRASLGSAFWTMEMLDEAEENLSRALDDYDRLGDDHAAEKAPIATVLVPIKFLRGQLPQTRARYEAVLAQAQRQLGRGNQHVLQLRSNLATMRFLSGEWQQASAEFDALVEDAERSRSTAPYVLAAAYKSQGEARWRLGEFRAALQSFKQALPAASAAHDVLQAPTSVIHLYSSFALMEQERFDEAQREVDRALAIVRGWARDEKSALFLSVRCGIGMLRVRQGRSAEAVVLLREVVNLIADSNANQRDQSYEWRFWLAIALRDSGQLAEAEVEARTALARAEAAVGSAHPLVQSIRIGLADVLRLRGNVAEARSVLDTIDRKRLDALGWDHPYQAELHRVDGLLALAERRPQAAQGALEAAQRAFESRYGASHSFSRRARLELASRSSAAARP